MEQDFPLNHHTALGNGNENESLLLAGRCYIESNQLYSSSSTRASNYVFDDRDGQLNHQRELQSQQSQNFSLCSPLNIGQVVSVVIPRVETSLQDPQELMEANEDLEAISARAFLCLVSPPPFIDYSERLDNAITMKHNHFVTSKHDIRFFNLRFDTSTFVDISVSKKDLKNDLMEDSSNKNKIIHSMLNSRIGVKCTQILDVVDSNDNKLEILPNALSGNQNNSSSHTIQTQITPPNKDFEARISTTTKNRGFVATILPSSNDKVVGGLMSLTLNFISDSKNAQQSRFWEAIFKDENASDNIDDASSKRRKNTLLIACVKREMVGRVVCNNAITRIEYPHFQTTDDGFSKKDTKTKFMCSYFTVTDLIPLPSDLQHERSSDTKRDSMGVYMVLPNTLVTIIDEENNASQSNQTDKKNIDVPLSRPKTLEKSVSQPPITSYAVRVLVETLRSINDMHKNRSHKAITTPKTFILSGPPGVGKTHAVRTAIANAPNPTSIHLTSIRGSEILSLGHISQAMAELRRLFTQAAKRNSDTPFSNSGDPNIEVLFLDECDALLTSSSPLISTQLGVLLDRISSFSTKTDGWDRLIVVAATNRIDSIPSWLRRPGRFDREIVVSPPQAEEREKILRSLLQEASISLPAMDLSSDSSTSENPQDDSSSASSESSFSVSANGRERLSNMSSSEKINVDNTQSPTSALLDNEGLAKLSEECVGYVAADLASLVRRALMLSLSSYSYPSGIISIELLKRSMIDVGASALRDASLSAPPTTRWDDIAGDAGGAKKALRRAVEWPRTKRASFLFLGLSPPRGILLHGPPGCAKTTLARAAAGASGIAFLSLSPADVYASSYVGEAESIIRRSFTLARSVAPCILFFDEIDAILGSGEDNKVGSGMSRGTSAEARVMSTFLNEMDGVDASSDDGVLVLGATNRPAVLDAALLRPGRFDSVIYVPPPDYEARRLILEKECHRWQSFASSDSDLLPECFVDKLAEDSASMTGAEIVGACREASLSVIRQIMEMAKNGENVSHLNSTLLQKQLEKYIRDTIPLLSDEKVLREYSSFNIEHNSKRI